MERINKYVLDLRPKLKAGRDYTDDIIDLKDFKGFKDTKF